MGKLLKTFFKIVNFGNAMHAAFFTSGLLRAAQIAFHELFFSWIDNCSVNEIKNYCTFERFAFLIEDLRYV